MPKGLRWQRQAVSGSLAEKVRAELGRGRLREPKLVSALFVLALAAAGCSGNAVEGDTGLHVERIGSVSCDGTYRNQSTASFAADAYGCYPDLSFPGSEWIQRFTTPNSGEVVVSVTDYSDYPFIAILRDDGSFAPEACVASNYYSVRFSAAAGESFYVVVDSHGSAPEMTFNAQVDCLAPQSEDACSDGFDNDADLLLDCADPDCDDDAACDVASCQPDGAIACGDTMITGSTEGFGATNLVDGYTCWSDRVPNSPERAYTFRPTTSGRVNFTLSDFNQYPMLFVIEDDGTGCNPNRCVAHNYYSVDFDAVAGKTYYLMVDGWGGTPFQFHASLICDPPASEATCDNGVDDDGDGTIDCADSDCDAEALCAPGVCEPALSIDCSTTLIAGDTAGAGSTNLIPSYACSPATATTAREFAYQLGPIAKSGPILVTASNYSTYPLITILEDKGNGCNPAACIAEQYYSVQFPAKRGKTYYVVMEGDPNLSSMTYDLSVVCNPPASEAGSCADEIDNDGDFDIDCSDPDCADVCARPCSSADTLAPGTTLLAGSTASAGSTNVIDVYSCVQNASFAGNEHVYTYTASKSGQVLFTLSNISDYATLAVMEDLGTGCDANSCIAFQYYSVVADVEAGKTYYVAVDSPNAGSVSYDISVVVDPPYNESGACDDGIDNDADFLIDCADPDCGCAP